MSHNKTVPQVKGDFLLGNLSQIMTNPFQALCDWQRNYGDLVSFRLATRQFYLFSHPKLIEQALIKQSDVFVKIYNPIEKLWKNTKRDSTHMKYFKTFEDLHDSVITTFKTYLQDASKVLCVMKKMREDFAITA